MGEIFTYLVCCVLEIQLSLTNCVMEGTEIEKVYMIESEMKWLDGGMV